MPCLLANHLKPKPEQKKNITRRSQSPLVSHLGERAFPFYLSSMRACCSDDVAASAFLLQYAVITSPSN